VSVRRSSSARGRATQGGTAGPAPYRPPLLVEKQRVAGADGRGTAQGEGELEISTRDAREQGRRCVRLVTGWRGHGPRRWLGHADEDAAAGDVGGC
jgi:hypothetical protein